MTAPNVAIDLPCADVASLRAEIVALRMELGGARSATAHPTLPNSVPQRNDIGFDGLLK